MYGKCATHARSASCRANLFSRACSLSSTILLLLGMAGCAATSTHDRDFVSSALAQRTGLGLGIAPPPCEIIWPCGADLADGLSEEEAVVVALWNNAAFQELLADLGVAQGDLVQAGLLPNPDFLYFFHVPDKPLKYAFEIPLEALWLRPIRIAVAERDAAQVADRLVNAGLTLIRDVRQAHADSVLARARLQVAEEAVLLRGQIAELAEKRLRAGDISPQEAATARIDSLLALQDRERVVYDIALADERLRNLMGIGDDRRPLTLLESPLPPPVELNVELITGEATASRPDALAAARGAEAAAERLRLAKLVWVRFLGIGDATSGRRTGHEFGPAFRVVVPIFNWNQGNIVRAEAELERAQRAERTVHDRVVLEVHQAHARYEQARAELKVLDGQVRPEVEAAIRRAEKAYQEGNTTYVVVLETTRQLLDSRLREAQLHAELRRAWAEVERSVGRRLDPVDVSHNRDHTESALRGQAP